jgi:hypothetical protein
MAWCLVKHRDNLTLPSLTLRLTRQYWTDNFHDQYFNLLYVIVIAVVNEYCAKVINVLTRVRHINREVL